MSRHSICVAVLCTMIASCSSSPNNTGADQTAVTDVVGQVDIPLTALTNGISYELASARFVITGAPLGKATRVVTPPADEPVDQETLPVGSYSILLDNGWQLLAKGPMDTAFAPVDASLITPNPTLFSVSKNTATDVVFRFATAAGVVVSIDRGQVNIRIDVQDCSSYDQYTAALGFYTVDCLGTIGPDSYSVDAAGFLRRNFDSCPLDPSKLQTINDLLGLQVRKQLPIAQKCIQGRWSQWKDGFDQSGIATCPVWKKDATINAPNIEFINRAIPLLPKPQSFDTGIRPAVIQQLKTAASYTVSFAQAPMNRGCTTPADCAAQCAGGFPGFVLRSDQATVLTDPAYWLLDTIFTPNPDPFLTMGYYHPMSYYGSLPGAIFGHRNRAPSGFEEQCSYYDNNSGIHYVTRLRLDCLPDNSSCVSICEAP